jgi:hypothetical protein
MEEMRRDDAVLKGSLLYAIGVVVIVVALFLVFQSQSGHPGAFPKILQSSFRSAASGPAASSNGINWPSTAAVILLMAVYWIGRQWFTKWLFSRNRD